MDYQTVEGHWVLRHLGFHQRVSGPLHLGRVSADFDTEFAGYSFTPP